MSHNPTDIRPDEEALAALLIIAALSFGSLFAVAKTAAKRFVGSTLKEDECGSQVEQGHERTEGQRRVGDDRDDTTADQDHQSRIEDNSFASRTYNPQETKPDHKSGRLPPIQAKTQLLSAQRARDREQGFAAIRAWELSTMSHEKEIRERERSSSLHQRGIRRTVRRE